MVKHSRVEGGCQHPFHAQPRSSGVLSGVDEAGGPAARERAKDLDLHVELAACLVVPRQPRPEALDNGGSDGRPHTHVLIIARSSAPSRRDPLHRGPEVRLLWSFSLASVLAVACNTATLEEPSSLPPDPGDTLPTYDGGDEGGGASGDAGSSQGDSSAPGVDAGKDSATSKDAGTDAALTSQVQVIVEPSDKAAALISAIQGAKTSIHMTMYLLTNDTVVSALVTKKNAGVEVKVVLNQNFPPNTPATQTNADSFKALSDAGVNVVWAPSVYTYTHEKCVIIDGATAWIMTMNVGNETARTNREYLAVDTEANDVAAAEAVFQADFTNKAIASSDKLLLAPANAKTRLLAFINGATKSIDVEGEEFSDSDVTSALAANSDAGVAVRLVLSDATASTAQTKAVSTLKQHNVSVVQLSNPYVHAKALVVDGANAYVGSANFTYSSLQSNRELGVLIGTASEVAKVATTIDTDFKAGTAL